MRRIFIIKESEQTERLESGELVIKGFPYVEAVVEPNLSGMLSLLRRLVFGKKSSETPVPSFLGSEYVVAVPNSLSGLVFNKVALSPCDSFSFKKSHVQRF